MTRSRVFRPDRDFWIALAASVASLAVLVLLDEWVSTGGRLYVLANIFKAGWAATLAVLVSLLTGIVMSSLRANEKTAQRSFRFAASEALKTVVVFLAAAAAFGYLMPDWSPWTVLFATVVLALWALAGLAAALAARG